MGQFTLRIEDIAERYVVEKERNNEIRDEMAWVIINEQELEGIDEILKDSDDMLKGYLACVEIKNISDVEFYKLVDEVKKLRSTYSTRLTKLSDKNVRVWDKKAIEEALKARFNLGLTLRFGYLQSVDQGLAMAVHRYTEDTNELFIRLFGITREEYDVEVKGKSKPKTSVRKFAKKCLSEKDKIKSENYSKEDATKLLEHRKEKGLSNEADVLREVYGSKLKYILGNYTSIGDLLESLYEKETVESYDRAKLGKTIYLKSQKDKKIVEKRKIES